MITPIDEIMFEKNKDIKNIESLIETVKLLRPPEDHLVKIYLMKLETERSIILKQMTEIIEDQICKEEN